MGQDGPSTQAGAPTTAIETLIVVRPIKVIAVIQAGLAMLLMLLSVAATTWLEAHRVREGLWEKCRYLDNGTDLVNCKVNDDRDWLQACRALCMIAMFLTLVGLVVTSTGLRTEKYRKKYQYYVAGMIIWFVAVGVQLIALVTFPIKFLDGIEDRAQAHWQFGWAYGLGWGAAVLVFVAALLLLIDKGAEEVLFKEVTIQTRDGLEEDAIEDV